MRGYLLDTNIPSEMRRIRPEPRLIEWLKAANDNELYLSVITLGEEIKTNHAHDAVFVSPKSRAG